MTRHADLIAKLQSTKDGRRIHERMSVDEQTGCWLWHGAKTKRGYGVAGFNGRMRLVHREVWRISVAEIQNGKFLCHTCDNPQCINPAHCYVGTHKDNMRDMVSRGRHWAMQQPERARRVFSENGKRNTWMKGERNHKAKLTEQQAKEIKGDKRPTKILMAEYGVGRTTIQGIRSGRRWKHV